jgi:rhodanese-related sulfurtransferase
MITASKTFCLAAALTALLVLSFAAHSVAETKAANTTSKTNAAIADASQVPPEPIAHNARPDNSCLAMSVDNVLYKLKQNQNLMLVDVRRPEQFERLRITGSINIPLYAIKTKSFLKSFPIIVVNEGFAKSQLDHECRRLNQKGFQAFILAGGLNSWSYRDGPLEGDLFDKKTFSRVSSQTYHQEKDYKNTIVIDVSEMQTNTSKQLIPKAIHLPAIGAAVKRPVKNLSLGDLSASLKGIKKNPNSALLITNQDGQGYEHIEKIIAKANVGPVFYLEGGLDGYHRFLNHLALSRQPKNTRIKTINECSTCGKKNEDERVE